MERIFRSVLQVGNLPDAEEALVNWHKLVEHRLDFKTNEDQAIFKYLNTFYGQMSAPPDVSIIREYFEKQDSIEVCARIDEIKKAQFYTRTNFLSIVRTEQEQQNLATFVSNLREAAIIAEQGRNLDRPINGKKILRGVTDAMGFMFDKMSELSHIETGEKLEGFIEGDAEEVIDEYDIVSRTNSYSGRNVFGLAPVDEACEGHRSGEFWVHCAAPGDLKTTTAINYAYNNAYVFGKHMFYGIFEMPYKQLRRQIFVLHSSHGKFMTEWHAEDRKAGRADPYVGIDYRKVRDGKLNELELKRFKLVAQDFKATCKGKIYLWRPSQQATVADVKRKAEMFHNKYGCDGVVLDNLSNLKPVKSMIDTTSTLNAIVTEARMLALNFARGNTVPVLGLFHMNRQGKLRAEKADGRYDVASISYANQIERDADVITYTYLDDRLRKEGKFYLGSLKNRDNPLFDRMVGKIFWYSKRMRHIESSMLDLDADRVLHASKQITLSAEDMID